MNKTTKWLLSVAVLLLVGASSTSIAVAGMLNRYNRTDEGAINISPESWTDQSIIFPEEETEAPSDNSESSGSSASAGNSGNASPAENTSAGENNSSHFGINEPEKSGFIVIDENDVVWGTETDVDIFKVSYENGEGFVTAESFNGEKIVAPGTENSYTFKLKNTGETGIRYTLNVDAYITPGDNMIPVEARISRYDEKWIVGGPEEWVDVPALDSAEDSSILSAGRYAYYTLDWRWPFEGDDEYDTYLGNLAVTEDITVTIVISTTAVAIEEGESEMEEGLVPPNTGDESILSLWIALAFGASLFLIIIVVYRIREEKRSKTEAIKIER